VRSSQRRVRDRKCCDLYLPADLIPRVQDHFKRRLDELLPGPWARAQTGA
jgi:hypothetical protein